MRMFDFFVYEIESWGYCKKHMHEAIFRDTLMEEESERSIKEWRDMKSEGSVKMIITISTR